MKHDGSHKLDIACMQCVKKHIEHKEKLLAFVKDIATGSFAYYKVKAIELLEEIEA